MSDSAFRNDDSNQISTLVREAGNNLASGSGDVILDLTSVHRLDSTSLGRLLEFAKSAEEHHRRTLLRSVDPQVYKALKLLKATHSFVFES